MPAYRYYCPDLTQNDPLIFEGKEFEHLSKVMRQKEGDLIELVDGKGNFAKALILSIEKKRACLNLQERKSYALDYSLTLYQAISHFSHLEWLVEKAVELGLTRLFLFPSRHSPKFSLNKIERLKLISISALKQCGRFFLPEISYLDSLDHLPSGLTHAYMGDLRDSASYLDFKEPCFSWTFCSGPEPGFTDEEYQALEKKGCIGARLHSNILRAETAPLAFLSLAHHFMMLKRKAPLIN